MGLLTSLKVQFHLASPREVQEHLDGLWRSPGRRFLLPRAKVLGAVSLVFAAAVVARLALPLIVLLCSFLQVFFSGSGSRAQAYSQGLGQGQAWDQARTRTTRQGLSVSEASRWRAELVSRLLQPEEVATVQGEHDRWQDRYGDEVYRTQLKPQAIRIAFWEYVETHVNGGVASPVDWTKSLDAEHLRTITRRAERDVLNRR